MTSVPTPPPHPRAPPSVRVERLLCRGFRNLAPLDLEPGPAFNVVHGENGAGKSSLLEAIHYLGALGSFRGAKTDDIVQIGEPAAELAARIAGEAAPRQLRVRLARDAVRQLALDGKRPRSIAVWHASVQMVLFHPGHVTLPAGPPEPRRAFLDRILEQVEVTYAGTLSGYQKALRSRNRLLRQPDADARAIRAYDELLAPAGAVIGRARRELVAELAPLATQAFAEVIGEELPLVVEYRPRVEPDADAIRRALERAYDKDRARGFTADGPHGDELALEMRRVPARYHASQGQHRAMVLALKVAELHALTRRVGRVPILLLDDVSSELDRGRNRRLFELLGRLGGQVFLTTTHPEFILLAAGRTDYRMEAGRLERTSS